MIRISFNEIEILNKKKRLPDGRRFLFF